MLKEKEYLQLCELAYSGLIDNYGVKVQDVINSSIQNNFLGNIESGCSLMHLKMTNKKMFENTWVYIFENDNSYKYIIFVADEEIETIHNELLMEIIDYTKENIGNSKCFISGMFTGGIYASYIALELNIEAILFGTITNIKIEGNVKNYVGENEAVGKYSDKVIFVKQQETEDINMPFTSTFIFDEEGNVVVGEQSNYSKFKSWVYYTSDNINEEVWDIFFETVNENESFSEKNIYSVFLKINELDENKIIRSIKDVIIHIDKQLTINRGEMEKKLNKNIDDIEEKDINEKLSGITEEFTSKAVEIVESSCMSVKTILKGLVLLTVGQTEVNINARIDDFINIINEILETERVKIKECVENVIDQLMYHQIGFPEYHIE
ncbi:UNVERIFIED_CONTAM: hypothetical protein Cloal_2529 [Acetivibrio alkalicellulosi]